MADANPVPVAQTPVLANFGFKRTEIAANADVGDWILRPGLDTPVDVLVSKDRQIAARIFHFCFRSMNEAEVDDPDLCSYYASMILNYAPGLQTSIVDALTFSGYTVTVCDGSAAHPYAGVELTEAFPYITGLLYFGQCVFLLYKNISSQSYERFMRNRVAAMCASVGASTDTEVSVVLPRARAAKIRSMMGSRRELRKAVLQFLLAAGKTPGPFGALCNYICNILAWTEMTAISIIMDALLIPNSPVIGDARVAGELRNLAFALNEVNSCDNPQFFRITESAERTRVVERSNFPTLIAVAQSVKVIQNPSLANFITTTSPNNPVVTELVGIHKQFLARGARSNMPSIQSYVTSYDNPELNRRNLNQEN